MDHTQLETLQRCEQETVYRHVRHLTTPHESLAAFFGRVVHEGVRAFYDAEQAGEGISGEVVGWRAPNRTTNGANAAFSIPSPSDLAAQAALAYWHDEITSGRVRLPEPKAGKPDHRTPELAAVIVRVYASLYGDASRRGYDVVMNERYLELPSTMKGQVMPSENSRRTPMHSRSGEDVLPRVPAAPEGRDSVNNAQECGIVDRVVRRHADGLLYVLDLKTSSWAPTAGYWRQWSNSQQAAIYLDLVADALGEQPAGFWCDHIFVSGRRDGPRPEDFVQFGPVTYSAEKRAELRHQRGKWRQLLEMLKLAPEVAQQSTRSCYRFQQACPYLGYCSADPADRELMIERDLSFEQLVVRPWGPARRDE